ncbi:ankyrin repeat domain-containing protein 28 [Colletotrichum tofieldiae]|nr:ankyrin repeat domain-containing protein 28 [Colletotrichum tofieldiae]
MQTSYNLHVLLPLTSADLEEQVIRLLSLKRDYYQQGHIVRLSRILAETIIDINGAFIHTRMDMRAKLINVHSTQEDLPTRVFDRFTSTVGNAFEIRLGVDKPHLELAFHSNSESDPVWRSINPDWLGTQNICPCFMI